MSKDPALVTVVMPVYNQAHFLPQALEGVFAQTYAHVELIVVDDGSTDATPDVLADYQRRYQFTIIRQTNQRLPTALNTGFASANGDYLSWTSSDNEMLPDMLAVLVSALEHDSAIGLVYADHYLMDDDGRDLGLMPLPDYDPDLILHMNPVHCCFLYRRICMEKVGAYDPGAVYGEDWEYWTRISRYYKMKRIPQPLYRYRLHRHSMTSDLVRGQARTIGYAAITAMVRRRSPWRWWMGWAKLRWIKSFMPQHPIARNRQVWLAAVAKAADAPVDGAAGPV